MTPQALASRISLVFVLGAATAFGAESGSSRGEKLSRDEVEFVNAAASAGMMEVQLGKTAQQRASNAEVKEFGRRMQTDHSKANDQLKKIAANKNVKLPAELESKHKTVVEKLSRLKGEEFDREYMSSMVDDHKEDIEKFEAQASKGKDSDVKKFASEQLPILKKHLALGEQTQKKLGGKTR
jgi:putative membrane protein